MTCAIGDGSNDVPMLREGTDLLFSLLDLKSGCFFLADVSVGLFGKEGRQAVM